MSSRLSITLLLLVAMLTYVSGLAMQLHRAWEHGPVASVAVTAAAGESKSQCKLRCSHGHDHSSKAPSEPERDPATPGDDDDCATCVALSMVVADVPLLFSELSFDHPLSQRMAIASIRTAHLTAKALHGSRGPPMFVHFSVA